MKKKEPTPLRIGNKEFFLVSNRENIYRLEANVGATITLCKRVMDSEMSLTDIASIMAAVAEPRIKIGDAMDLLLKYGSVSAYRAIPHFFTQLLLGGAYDPKEDPTEEHKAAMLQLVPNPERKK